MPPKRKVGEVQYKPKQSKKTVRKGTRNLNIKIGVPQTTKRTNKTKKDVQQDKKINKLTSQINSSLGHYSYIRRTSGEVGSTAGRAEFRPITLTNTNLLVETVLGSVPYFNTATPSAPTLVDVTGGNFSKEYRFTNVSQYIRAVNNYNIPVYAEIVTCVPRSDTSKTPINTYNEGIGDVCATNTDMLYMRTTELNDSPHFKKLFKVAKTTKKLLQPGDTISQWYNTGSFVYDCSYNDTHTSTYKPVHGAFATLIRVEGQLGHNSDLLVAEQCQLEATLDYEQIIKFDLKYDAGGAIRWNIVSDDAPTSFTTTPGEVSNKPEAVAQGHLT